MVEDLIKQSKGFTIVTLGPQHFSFCNVETQSFVLIYISTAVIPRVVLEETKAELPQSCWFCTRLGGCLRSVPQEFPVVQFVNNLRLDYAGRQSNIASYSITTMFARQLLHHSFRDNKMHIFDIVAFL